MLVEKGLLKLRLDMDSSCCRGISTWTQYGTVHLQTSTPLYYSLPSTATCVFSVVNPVFFFAFINFTFCFLSAQGQFSPCS